MKKLFLIMVMATIALYMNSCRTTKQINKVIAPKDTSLIKSPVHSDSDSLLAISNTLKNLRQQHINFRTFNAIKDSAIWISLNATFLNFEVYRVLVTKDSIILLNRQNKEVQFRSLDYLQDVTQIPFDFYTLQDLLVGNPVFLDSNVISYRKSENKVLFAVAGIYFKHLLTLSADNYTLLHSKLDDVDITRNRTADITYSGFENNNGFRFSTYREITLSEKNKLDIQLNFKQYEFNKELSVFINIPKNYKRK
jgi:Domain of unknown function (DUF4292)